MNESVEQIKDKIENILQAELPQSPSKEWLLETFGTEEALSQKGLDGLLVPTRELARQGGKRWRPVFMVLCAHMATQDQKLIQDAYQLSPLLEFVHTASLIHDDIEDRADERRGKPCAYITYGLDTALNAGAYVSGSSGKLYGMLLDGSNDIMQFDQGVSALSAYGEYIYFHNLRDSYIVSSDTQEWLDGCLYRLNVKTNQYIRVLSQYDWNYRPTDYGLVVYREKSLSLAALSGENEVTLYEPVPYNYMAILDDCVLLYEYNLKKLTS
ncbi:MAG: polyprenyl synthetase family protein, partial [Treponema sp.]|nr:polyprenyl synthetase family protein [Treponema sp.]